ncbi:phospholipase A1 PLIP1, chloroplastic isoform X1 [Magnolia sinica]|uniref:phospholipase A1 PLIP1, chloroplastic isoform X1 n=1 Tax=Magnolia sinica TaxID=86752 RepID=UPI002659193B|nr:phospholipase A1 PLIP1, chloroplastic isoform X1 [Magnolia sinica]XP_058095982.1 phospholipase A1 PLIP1, chloroplastic isoform X1 [Magnolia sinica]
MACTSVAISSPSVAAGKDLVREHNGLRRSHSSKELYDRAGIRRSQSDPQLRCSLKPVRAVSTEPKLKNNRSVGIFPFQISGSILPSSLRSFLFESDYSKEMRLVDSEEETEGGEQEMEKRANWVERLLELRSRWRSRQKENEGEEGEGDEDYCSVGYDSEVEEEEEEMALDSESFSRFLVRVPWSETKLFSKLAFLCNMAYVIPELKAEDLRKYYGLRFITSSLEKKAEAAAIKAKLDQDSTHVPDTPIIKSASENEVGSEQKRAIRPSVAYEIAASAASYVHSRAKGLLSLAGSHSKAHQEAEDDEKGEDADVDARGAREEGGSSPARVYKSEVAAYVAATTMTAVVAAEETAKLEAARDLRSLHSSPCEWFMCDDPSTYTRFFVIQGSDSLASWQANLFFEPTKFEGTEVLVHRGIYEAAKGIFEQFMPEILNHLNLYGERARLRFTGHSLGGSLSLLVHLMLVARGVVKPSALLPVVTFGSPFVFCGGRHILDDLGLDESYFYSVMMHRDIVPRAFSCNYPNHVAQVLKRLNAAFRSHPCLNNNKLLYSPMGQLYILQPDEKSSPPHPLLPSGSGLYALDNAQGSSPAGIASALRAFLNSPHPLDTLSDPTAYGSEGTILRDHDSSNYLKAVNGVLRQHTKWVVRRSRRQRLHHWWPLLTMSPHAWSHEGNLENPGLVTKEVVTGV